MIIAGQRKKLSFFDLIYTFTKRPVNRQLWKPKELERFPDRMKRRVAGNPFREL
jgi:hypothetical protein